jgi:hypothetical protein
MKTLFKIAFIFLAITAASTLLYNYTNVEFGRAEYFDKHGWLFLFSIAFFPRLTLLVSGLLVGSIQLGGLIWWGGFFFAPRILVATLATVSYWHNNPILVIISWLIALGGESSEKFVITKRMTTPKRYDQGFSGSTIEAEYKVKN